MRKNFSYATISAIVCVPSCVCVCVYSVAVNGAAGAAGAVCIAMTFLEEEKKPEENVQVRCRPIIMNGIEEIVREITSVWPDLER